MAVRRGQAMIELGVGVLTLAIVVSLLCGFALYMARSLRAQNTARSGHAEGNGSVEVRLFFGQDTIDRLEVRERVQMPSLTIR